MEPLPLDHIGTVVEKAVIYTQVSLFNLKRGEEGRKKNMIKGKWGEKSLINSCAVDNLKIIYYVLFLKNIF